MAFYEIDNGPSIAELFLLMNTIMTVVCALFYFASLKTIKGIGVYALTVVVRYSPVLATSVLLFVIAGLSYLGQYYIEPLSFLSIGRGFEWAFYWKLSITFVMMSWNLLLICFFVDFVERLK